MMLSSEDRPKQERRRTASSSAWKPGQSGNPRGRPTVAAEIRDLARNHAREAIERLVALVQSDNPQVALRAAEALLDRGYGRPMQAIQVNGNDKRPIQSIEVVLWSPPRSLSSGARSVSVEIPKRASRMTTIGHPIETHEQVRANVHNWAVGSTIPQGAPHPVTVNLCILTAPCLCVPFDGGNSKLRLPLEEERLSLLTVSSGPARRDDTRRYSVDTKGSRAGGMGGLAVVKREARRTAGVALYLFVCFSILATLNKLFLATYQIEVSALVPAVIGTLALAKVVV